MGDRVRFWRDKWCGEMALEVMFPLIFYIVIDREATVASYAQVQGHGETVDHLLICCLVALHLWMFIVAIFGLAWVQPWTVRVVLQSWAGRRVAKRHQKETGIILICEKYKGTSDSRTVITEIIKSKVKLYAALHKVDSTQTGTSLAIPVNKGKDIEVSGYISNTPNTAIPYPWSGQLNIIPATHQPYIPATHQPYVPTAHQPFHEFKKPKFEPSSEAITITPPIVFVPPALGQPLAVGSSSTRKRRKKKAKKKSRVDAQLPVAVVPSSQIPSYSVAQ
ncbi:hypothetical protein CsSME_00003458 [Camellia sinensis var. sinensis]